GILGMTELALGAPMSEEAHGYVTLVRHSAKALLVVINDILDFSKIEAGKLKLEQIPFPLSDAIRQSLAPIQIEARKKGIDLRIEVSPSLPPRVSGDPVRICQVLTNLAANALKFTEKGWISVTVEQTGPTDGVAPLRFRVSDTGCGIPVDKQHRLFRSFS